MGNSCVLWCSCTETAFTVLVTNLRQRKNDNLFLPFHQVWLDAVQDLFTIVFCFHPIKNDSVALYECVLIHLFRRFP